MGGLEFVEQLGCQRWRSGRASYRPKGEPINTSRYEVGLIEEREARRFVEANHYAGSLPPTRVRVGLFRKALFTASELVGVAVFSVPVQAQALPCYFGVGNEGGVELGRLVLLDDVEANGESYFVAKACKLLKEQLPGVKAVLSYADPMERTRIDGVTVKRGHFGGVYRALSASYLGRSAKRTLILDAAGRVVSERSLSKIRGEESGAAGAYRMLREAGAPERLFGEGGSEYVERALKEGPFRRMRHPGNLVFGWGVGSAGDKAAIRRVMRPMPYPAYGC